ncbi:hypothetical protein GWK47_012648 [Chionoecetes opilio]|uniref:Uncharacterized protein n=1 Tax=Chionoecetes opilio TaxID=41210 RepID=A0A8J4XUN0_CHIOP|nr:hypothetical protein GWK47_012648 [Chionoecetes opilio]
MAGNQGHEDWELRPFSSGTLKKSSSVEILLGTKASRGRLLATSPTSSHGHVTTHNMKGSGRPTNTDKAGTLPPSTTPPSGTSPSVPAQDRDVAKVPAKDSETPKTASGKEKNIAMNPELAGTSSLRPVCEPLPLAGVIPVAPLTLTPVAFTPVTSTAPTPIPLTSKPITSTLVPSISLTTPTTSSPLTSTPLTPKPSTSTPSTSTPATSTPLTSTPSETTKPPPLHINMPQTPPLSRLKNLKEKGSHLPPLVTSHSPEYQSPIGTPKVTPKGTPIIGKRGHVFSVSTPDVMPATGQPLPLISLLAPRGSILDPFELRRKIRPAAGAEGREEPGDWEEEDEPVWQKRLSLLFIPPTEDELEPDKVRRLFCRDSYDGKGVWES